MALQLGYIEVGAGAFGQQRLIVVQEVEGKIEQATWDGLAIKGDMFFRQVQTAYPADEYRRIGGQGISLSFRTGVRDGAVDRIAQVDLTLDHLIPGGSQ